MNATNQLQNYFSGIQNAFAGASYHPGSTPNSPGYYTQPNLPKTVTPAIPVYDPRSNSYSLPTTGTPTWNGTHFVNEAGVPFTGTYGGQTYTNGQTQQQIANSPSRYAGINITKNAPIAGATDQLLTNFKPTSGVTDFSNILDAARSATRTATNAFANDQSAFNVQPLADTLNNLNAGYTATGNALNNRYSNILGNTAANQNAIVNASSNLLPQQFNALQGINDQYAATGNALNDAYSGIVGNANTTQNNIVQQGQDLLPAYDTAANNIGDAQTKALIQQLSRYKLAGGTPTGLGGGEEQLLTNGIANIRLPLEQAKINQRYNLLQNLNLPVAQQEEAAGIGQLQNFSMPLASDVANRNYNTQAGLNQAQQNLLQNIALPLAGQQGAAQVQQLTGFTAPLAQQDYTNAATTAQTIQNLKLQIAGKSIAEAVQYLQAMAVPAQIQQQILAGNQSLQSGDISNLSGLNSLYSGSRYQGLQDLLGANLTQPTASTFSPGPFPSSGANPRYSIPAPGNSTATAGALPASAPGAAPAAQPPVLPQGAWASTLQPAGGNLYKDPKTGNYFTVVNGQIYPYQVNGGNVPRNQNGYPTSVGAVDNTGDGSLVYADNSNSDQAGG